MAAVEVPQTLEYRGGQLNVAPVLEDFQDSPNDEEDIRSSYEYLNDIEEEYQARALLAKFKRFFKKELRPTKDFEAKYNKAKAKLALLSSSALASKATTVKNKGLIAKAHWSSVLINGVKYKGTDPTCRNTNIVVDAILETPTNTEGASISKEDTPENKDVLVGFYFVAYKYGFDIASFSQFFDDNKSSTLWVTFPYRCFFLVLWPLDYRSASFGIKSQVVQMVGRGRPPRNARRTTDRGRDVEQRDPRDIKIEHLQQRIRDLEIQREIHDDETLSNPSDWYDEENPFGAHRPNLRGTNRDDPLRNFGMKIEIPEFVGKAHPDKFIDWLNYAKLIWEDLIHKLSKKTKEKIVPYPSFFHFHSESALGHDASADSTVEADPGLSAPNDSISP
nr:reverse transcriptase domain-containing protein [Tanacetum cinerariifolium]